MVSNDFSPIIFQFTPPCGGGLAKGKYQRWLEPISIHAPVWGRAGDYRAHGLEQFISIHAPVWGRAASSAMFSHSLRTFQFTPPCGGGPMPIPPPAYMPVFQFTPPCGGGPHWFTSRRCASAISIHAPVWGRAAVLVRPACNCCISIHAPVWGRAANLHKCKVLFMCKMVETRDRINGKRWIISKLVQYTDGGFVLFEQKHPGRYCANLPAYSVLPRSAQQLAYRRIGSPVCTRPVRPMVSMRV